MGASRQGRVDPGNEVRVETKIFDFHVGKTRKNPGAG